MTTNLPLATHHFETDGLGAALTFLKRTRGELRQLRMVRVYRDRLCVFDVNLDCFEITGLGYPDSHIIPVLHAVNAVFRPDTIHAQTSDAYKEFKTGRRYAWAADRVM